MKKIFLLIFIIAIFSVSLRFPTAQTEEIKTEEIKTEEDLGKLLFFDPILSKNNKISCASCHLPDFAFADTLPFSKGVEGRIGKRNTPSAMNMASRVIFFFDGRAATLEEQAVFPIQDHLEMDIDIKKAVEKVSSNTKYVELFKKVFQSEPTKELITRSLAQYQRSLESSSPFDEYMAGDTSAISPSAIRGHALFTNPKNKCFECHFSPDFTGDEFKNVGIFDGKKFNDSGRYLITKNKKDLGAFKVPGLRNVAVTAPYMHNGMFGTLAEVLEYYNNPKKIIPNSVNLDTMLHRPLNLSKSELKDLENFLISLTDRQFLDKVAYVQQRGKKSTKLKMAPPKKIKK